MAQPLRGRLRSGRGPEGTPTATSYDMRFGFAAFMFLHGIAHIVGFFGAWAPTRTTIIGDRIDLGTSWIKLVGLGWLLLALAFGATAIATVAGASDWARLALIVTTTSLALCVLQLPETKFGLVLNVALLGGLIFGQRAGWF